MFDKQFDLRYFERRYPIFEKFNVSQNPKAKESRAQIVPMSQFASIVNSIPELKYIWNQDSLKASSVYHKIIKFNFKAFEYIGLQKTTS